MHRRSSRPLDDLGRVLWGTGTAMGAFVLLVVGLCVSLPLLPFVVGVPVGAAFLRSARGLARHDRRRLGLGLDGGGAAGAPGDVASLAVHAVTGFLAGVVALTWIAVALGVLTSPAWSWALPDDALYGAWRLDHAWELLVQVPIGGALLLATGPLLRGLLALERVVAAPWASRARLA